MPRQELAVMLHRRRLAVFLPVSRNRADAMRADGDDLLDLVLLECFEIIFGELAECQIVAEPAGRVACTLLFSENAEAGIQAAHHGGERCDNLPALRVVSAHASQPQTILLAAVKDGQFLFLNELVALGGGEAQRVSIAFQIQEQLGSIVVFPFTGVYRAAPQADDYGEMLHPDGALEFTRAAGCALKRGFLRE